ncbi:MULTISPECIES: ATP-binding protein [unclassified Sulfurospirillum]|uniref:ATP-binding protein n=1 Tax=unclassified Sulfurospirillum TaxID=2618290 RepID=UPI000A8D2C4D|nr:MULTISPECIES: ATP-binding protein [unclassified Sulfurospirillum]
MMKEIVVISGKGGTGKTSITAALASLAKESCIVVDCDVDAADLHLLLQPDFAHQEDFYSGKIAHIDKTLCRNCGRCADVCRFDAIDFKEGHYVIDALSCEGCGYCSHVCRPHAIVMSERNVGSWYHSHTKYGNEMIHAKLNIGAENSGKLVAKVKKEGKAIALAENKSLLIVDGSPGIGCPVVSSLSGANFVLLVTEPTLSGLHDLKRVYEVVKRFRIKAGCIINKYDLNTTVCSQIEQFLEEESILHVKSIPYMTAFSQAMIEGKTVTEYTDPVLKKLLEESFETIKQTLGV